MADSLNLSTTPLFIAGGTEYEADIVNGGPGTIYYSTANTVSSTSYDGTIASGNRLHVTSPKWIVSTTNTKVFIDRYATYTEDVDYDVKVVGEVLNLSNDGTTDQAATLQAAQNNIESQGGGRILIGRSGRGSFALGSLVTFGHSVNIQGQGKRESVFKCTAASAGFYFVGSGDAGYSGSTNRGGKSGGFHLNGNNTATTVMTMRSTNRIMEDIRLATPANNGTALYVDQAQNVDWYGIEAEDSSHSSSRTVKGIVFDGAASGHNFHGTSLNEFTNGHVVFDSSYDAPSGLGIDYSNNITFVGNMIERTDTYNPVIYGKAGTNITFLGGNITSGGTTDSNLVAEYPIVKLDNSATRGLAGGGSSPTKNFSFYGVSFTGTLGAASAKFANVFQLENDLTSWHQHVYLSPSCSYSNCKYLALLNAGSVVFLAPGQDNSSGGGLSSGWSNPAGAGKVNTRIQSSANSITTKAQISYYELTGNTTLNTLSASYEGHQITIKFSGAPTVSSSAGNIKLSGLVDMSATADDLLCLICDGTSWHETARVVK